MDIKTAEAIIRQLMLTNFVRLLFFLSPLTLRRCGVKRTPLQIYRSIKRKRAHRQIRTARRWRKRKNMTIRDALAQNFWKSMLGKDTVSQLANLAMTFEKMQEQRNA